MTACSHKDKDAPLAFVPADAPYVLANLDVPDDATRAALLAQADTQWSSQLMQLNAAADRIEIENPDAARLLHAVTAESNGKTLEQYFQNAGLNISGHFALYGVGLAPVARLELSDTKAFERFIGRIELAYGKPLDTVKVGTQSYQKYTLTGSGTEIVLAVIGKYAVVALLPAQPTPTLLRQALGLDRPAKNMQDSDRLTNLVKTKGYQKWFVGSLDLTRVLPLAISNSDPLISAIRTARAAAESARTGEPIANQLQTSPTCNTDASRIAARVPSISFGYTRLDSKHQEMRLDVALADDISKAFSGLKVALPGLGNVGTAPLDVSIALPVAQLRAFWSAQAVAVAAKPFTCPMLTDLNDSFAKLSPFMQKAAIPPFGDLLGVRVALDSLVASPNSSVPAFTSRLVLGSNDPEVLLGAGQMMVPALRQSKPTKDGKPVALSAAMIRLLGQPAWMAMSSKALALGIGAGEDAKLSAMLKDDIGGAGRLARIHLTGAMYLSWLQLLEQKADSFAATAAAISKSDSPSSDDDDDNATEIAANAERSKAQFAAMQAQAKRIESTDAEMHINNSGMVITSQTLLK
ncbi:MAG: hypothetical protein ABI114_13165 [Rhodanobacter sp.]